MAAEIADTLMDKPPAEQIADAIRVGHSRRGNADYVLVRDWLSRELDKKKSAILGERAVTIQAAYRGVSSKHYYAFMKKTAFQVMSMIRGAVARLSYYPKKAAALETMNRSVLTCVLRASLQRKKYYLKRAESMKKVLLHCIQERMYATVMRHVYRKKKEEILEAERAAALEEHMAKIWKENARKQRERQLAEVEIFRRYDNYSEEYLAAWLKELFAEGEKLDDEKLKYLTAAKAAIEQACSPALLV